MNTSKPKVKPAKQINMRRFLEKCKPAQVHVWILNPEGERTEASAELTCIRLDGEKLMETYASAKILFAAIAHWKNMFGSELFIDGFSFGSIERQHPELRKRGYFGYCMCHSQTLGSQVVRAEHKKRYAQTHPGKVC